MKKIFAFILILTLFFTQPAFAEIYYSDVFNHWSRNDVNYATNVIKVFNGYNDMTFRPDNDISRSEFITILVRTGYKLGVINEVYESSMNYPDMNVKQWSYTYVISFYEHMKKSFKEYSFEDIFGGTKFEPNKPITREEAVALIGVLCKASLYDNEIGFTDVNENHKYYKQIKIMYNSDILTGYNDNTLRLNNNISRAESAALIKRVYENVKQLNGNYMANIKYMPVKGEDVLSFFGSYNVYTQNENEKKYIKAKNTLEYLDFGGYIFPEDKHLYDADPIGTMKALRNAGFPNKAGVNFYLLKFGKLSNADNVALSNEILRDIANRNDLTDAALMQLFTQVSKYNTTEALYMDALKKWYDTTTNNNVKFNIKAFRYSYYIKNGNKTFVKAMMYEELQAGTNFDKILNINWNVKTDTIFNFLDMSQVKMYLSIYNTITYNPSIDNISNANASILKNIVIVENNEPVNLSSIKSEDMYYKYSLNKAYILKYIGEKERAFADLMNDYKIVKSMNIYKNNKSEIDDNYNGILKYFKK